MTQPVAYLYEEFLESAEGRPIRILAEYLEPLRRFQAEKIQDTVVFFGSARVDSRERAERPSHLKARASVMPTSTIETEAGQDAEGARLGATTRMRANWPGC